MYTAAVPGATYTWTGPGGFNSGLQSPTISPVQLVNGGVYSLTVTVNNCTSIAGTATVIVNPTPTISTITPTNPTTCGGSNGSISLDGAVANTTYGITYLKNSVAQPSISIASNGTGSLIISGLSAGTYTNFVITLNGCSSLPAGPVTLTDPPIPAAPTASSNGPVCQGGTINLTASALAGGTYTWTGPLFSSTSQNPSIPNATAANSGTYSVTVTLNNCTSSPSTTSVVVNATPTTTAGSNSPICEGTSINLSATSFAGATYSWSGPGFNSNSQNPTIPNATPSASGTYTVTSSLNGCSAISSVVVTVNPLPPAPLVSNINYCQLAVAIPLVATGQNLLWYTSATGGSGNPTAPIPSTSSAGTFTWYVSQSVAACEGPRTPIVATVIPKPAAPSVTSSITYCQFETANPLAATGQNLKWYSTSTGGSGSTATPTVSTTVAGVSTWYVSQTVNGCESDRASITVSVNAKPGAPLVTTPVLYCKDNPASALTAQGQNLLWYSSATGGIGATTAPIPSTATIGNTVYYVSQTIQGCESDRSAIEVQVNDKTEIHISLSKSAVCEFDTIVISAAGANPPGATFTWSFDGGTVLSGSGIGPYSVRWSAEGTKTITVIASNVSCTATDSKQVDVDPSPSASFVIEPHACLDEVLSVQAAWGNLENSAYTWNFDGADVLNGSGPGAYKLKWDQAGVKVVSLTTFEHGCRSEPFYDSITIHADPLAKIDAAGIDNLCSGAVITVQAKDDNSSLINSYVWGPKEYFSRLGGQVNQATVRATGFIHVTVTDPYGCNATDSLYVETKPCCNVYLPDAFTPNGDGINDVFRLITIGNHKLTDFRVVNRWGQAVFEGGDIKSGWDGTLGGEPQSVGTYFYYLRYQCGTGELIEKKGEVALIR